MYMKKMNYNDIFFSCFHAKHVLLTCYNRTLSGCPVPYTGVFSNSKRAGLRFVATAATYPNARCDCTADGGDLIKIDTQTMLSNFLAFIASK